MAGLHRSGKKITKSHSSIIDAAIPLIDHATRMSEIEKISLGTIKQIGTGTPRLKFTALNGGMKMTVRGRVTTQDIFIYTKHPENVQAILTEIFASKHR